MICVGLFRDYITNHKRYFTLFTVFIAGVAGLLPDSDIPLSWIAEQFGYEIIHGGFFHTPFFGLLFLIPGWYFWEKKEHKIATYFFVMTFGVILHLFLDFFLGGGKEAGIMFLWPLTTQGWMYGLFRKLDISQLPMALDAVLLLFWLGYIEIKHRLVDVV